MIHLVRFTSKANGELYEIVCMDKEQAESTIKKLIADQKWTNIHVVSDYEYSTIDSEQ